MHGEVARAGNTTRTDGSSCMLREVERCRLRSIFERLVAIIVHLAERSIAFLGTVNKLYSKSNGNFLGHIELMDK
jgi:hypothetical protein